MRPGDAMAELRGRYSQDIDQQVLNRNRLTSNDIQRWLTAMEIPRSEPYNRIAARRSFGFQNSEITFEFCDAVGNDIFRMI